MADTSKTNKLLNAQEFRILSATSEFPYKPVVFRFIVPEIFRKA